jgi:hypothetical protein
MKTLFRLPAGSSRLLFVCASLTASLFGLPLVAQAAEPSIAYTVQPKDELSKMSEASFQSPEDWKEVAKLNRLKNPNAIQPGQVLQIPLRMLKKRASEGVLTSVAGEVRLSGKPAFVGDAVPEGAQLQTGANSSVQVRLGDGSLITLMPNTQTTLVTSQSIDMGSFSNKPSSNWFTGLLRLTKGSVEVLAAKLVKRNTPLRIETPTSVVGVRGTEFRVAYDDPATQNARTEVLTGLVRADSSNQKIGADLPKGTGTVLNPKTERVKVSPLLKAPKLPDRVVVAKPEARWAMPTLAGAERFKVQISGFKDFSNVVREMTVSQQAPADFSGLPNGVWQLRVRGIDADTLEGFNADTTLQVLLAASPGQIPAEWQVRNDRLDVVNGQHVLQFDPKGLDPSHTLLASVVVNRPPYMRVAKALVKPDGKPIRLDLGALQEGESYGLNITVTQANGATLSPTNYQFQGLADNGHADAPLRAMANQEAAPTAKETDLTKPGKRKHKRERP